MATLAGPTRTAPLSPQGHSRPHFRFPPIREADLPAPLASPSRRRWSPLGRRADDRVRGKGIDLRLQWSRVLHIHHRAICPDERLDGRQFVNADGGESPALLSQDYPLNTRHQSGQGTSAVVLDIYSLCFPTSARDCAWLALPRSTRRSSSSISLALPAAASRSSHIRPRRQILPKVVTRLRAFRSQPVGDSWACEPPPTLASSSLGLGCRPQI